MVGFGLSPSGCGLNQQTSGRLASPRKTAQPRSSVIMAAIMHHNNISKAASRWHFFRIYQPMNIALQNPCGSHNRRCVQRFFLFGYPNPRALPGAMVYKPFRLKGKIISSICILWKTGQSRQPLFRGLGWFPVTMQVKWSVKRFADAGLKIKLVPECR